MERTESFERRTFAYPKDFEHPDFNVFTLSLYPCALYPETTVAMICTLRRKDITIRRVVIIGLWMGLAYWLKIAINRNYMERTSFATSTDHDSFQWPLVTICPILVFGGKSNQLFLSELNSTLELYE